MPVGWQDAHNAVRPHPTQKLRELERIKAGKEMLLVKAKADEADRKRAIEVGRGADDRGGAGGHLAVFSMVRRLCPNFAVMFSGASAREA